MNLLGHANRCRCCDDCVEHGRRLDRERKRLRYADPELRRRRLDQNREWKKQNPDLVRAEQARYRAAHPEKVQARKRAWKHANPEKLRADHRNWATRNAEKLRAYRKETRARYHGAQLRWRAANADYVKQVKRSYEDDRERVVNPRAVNRRTRWSLAEIRIALDPTLTEAEAALRLGRTVRAVSNKRYKARRAAA